MKRNPNIIEVDLSPSYRADIAAHVKAFGFKRTEEILIATGLNHSFIKALFKKIMRTNAW